MGENKKEKENGQKGHQANKPTEIPTAGWKEIGSRVVKEISRDHVQIVSAGVGFYFFMALFPSIVAAISLYGLVADPGDIQSHISSLTGMLPKEAYGVIESFIEPIVSKPDHHLGWGLAFSILISIWSANQGTSALFEGVNIAYNEEDTRGFIKRTAITLLFTLGGLVLGLIAVLAIIFYPALIDHIHLGSTVEAILRFSRWIFLAVIVMLALAVVYKKAPHRDNPEFR